MLVFATLLLAYVLLIDWSRRVAVPAFARVDAQRRPSEQLIAIEVRDGIARLELFLRRSGPL